MKIFLSCGIGDFIAIERFMSEYEKQSVTEIYFCTRMATPLADIINQSQVFPNLQCTHSLHDNWWTKPGDTAPFYVTNVKSVNTTLRRSVISPQLQRELQDLSCLQVFQDIRTNQRRYGKSAIYSFYRDEFSSFSTVPLPENYVAIHPFSENNTHDQRDFTVSDWNRVITHLERYNLMGVIVNKAAEDYVPKTHRNIIDLTNQVSLHEAFSIVCNASYFIGCASVHSVLFTKGDRPSVIKAMWKEFSKPTTLQYKFYYGSKIPNPAMKVCSQAPFLI